MESVETDYGTFIDAALAQIDERLTLERLSKAVPIIANVVKERAELVRIMHRVSCVMQKHQLTLMYDETGKTVDGFEPHLAAQECKDALSLIRLSAIRYQ